MFGNRPPIQIEIDTSAIHSRTPEVAGRLERIAGYYRQLDEMLRAVESRLPDLALPAVEPGNVDPVVPDVAGIPAYRPAQPR